MVACVKEFCRSFLILILYLGFHLLSFSVTTSVCIGIALLIVFTIEVWFGILAGKHVEVPQYVALGLTIVFLFDAVQVTSAITNLSARFRTRLNSLKKKFPLMLNVVPWILYAILILGSLSQLYWQYEITHIDLSNSNWSTKAIEKSNTNNSVDLLTKPIGNNSSNNMTEAETTFEGPDYRHNVTIFVFALASLVFCSAKVIQTDLEKKFRDLPDDHEMEFFIGTFSLLLCQIVLTVGYTVPLINVLILLEVFECSQGFIFLSVNVTAILMGVCAGFIESRDPFPVQAGEAPNYCFENQARARSLIVQLCLLPFIPYSFFNTSATQEYDPGYPAFAKFTIVISLTILHITKILSTTYILNERRRQRDLERLELIRLWYVNTILGRNSARNVAVGPAAEDLQEFQLDMNANVVNVEETGLELSQSNNSEDRAQISETIARSPQSNESDNNNNNSPSEITQTNSSLLTSTSSQSEEVELRAPNPSRNQID